MKYLGALALAVLGAVALLTVTALGGNNRSTQPSGVTITPLAHATIGEAVRTSSNGIKIRTRGPRDMLVTSITVDPGGTFGWHSHPGPVLVSVASGTLTLIEPSRHHCEQTTVAPGQGFIEDGGDVHLARNKGSVPIQLYVTFLAKVGTTEFLTEEPEPAVCRGR
jgi:quercetin dioxygenase-like cupin family protein